MNYMNPPFSQLNRLANFLYDNPSIKGVLIIPKWPAQAWYAKLLLLASKVLILPKHKALFLPGFKSNVAPLHNRAWETLALYLPSKKDRRLPQVSKLYVQEMDTIN